jgi:LmbE family N-acetylglucosaminyl deacetylase
VLALRLNTGAEGALRILAIGAHSDDIEIGAGGTLLALAQERELQLRSVVFTGTPERRSEAQNAAHAFTPGADVEIDFHDLPDGRLPSVWSLVKDLLHDVASSWQPELVLAPAADDAHQDHRTIGEIVPTVFRDTLYLAYEVPKWDGDLRRPRVYVPLSAEVANRKVQLLNACFPSQRARDWWDDEIFLGLARLRGMECRAPYAEAFACTKCTVIPG